MEADRGPDAAQVRELDAPMAALELGSLLDLVEGGAEVIITRGGTRFARLVSDPGRRDVERARRAADEIRSMRAGVTLGGLKIKDLVDEGRP